MTMPNWIALPWWVDFDAPQYLLLFALLPIFWLIGRRSLQSLGSWRRRAAVFLRLAVATMLIIALAEPNWLTFIHRLTVLFVVDGSASIQREELASAVDYVNAAALQRNATRGDRAGVIVFGHNAAIEVPPTDHMWQLARMESDHDPRFTNLEAALQLAGASFPADSARRLVIVSDGNENLGRAGPLARRMLDSGIGIDCVPISYQRRGDVAVEKVVVPADVRRGAPFSLRVVLNNANLPDSQHRATGTLRITREMAGTRHTVAEEPLALEPGKNVLTVRQELEQSGMATYEATFFPDHPDDDAYVENNSATAFSRVSGRGHVLLVETASQSGKFDSLLELLRDNGIEVTLRDTRRPFDNLADLQQFDSVILADVPRVAEDGPADLTLFSDAHIRELVQNTEHFGCGLVVLGGPNSFGAGGWVNTPLEEAMPVDFQIDSMKVEAVGALVLVIDTSGSMSGEKIAWSKSAAVAAAQMLGRRDYIGVVAFDTQPRWIVPVQRNDSGDRARALIARMGAGGGTDMMPALREGYNAIQQTGASLKHVIALTDGLTPKDDYDTLVTRMREQGITTTGVAVGSDADRMLLAEIAQRGGGKFYHVQSPQAIPRIFMHEARRVALPLVFEDASGIATQIVMPEEMLSGIDRPPPPVTGYVLTTVKQDPLVEVLLATPRQPQPNSTILATRQYGLGRTVALTTDVGQRWATAWQQWPDYDKLMLQLVRWSMRSHDMHEQLAISTEARDGSLHVVVHVVDQDDAHLNYLSLLGTSVRPDGEAEVFSLEQVAPGRYEAELPAEEPGNYHLAVSGGRSVPLRAAVSVPPTVEFDRLRSNEVFLAGLAEGKPVDGEPGRLIRSPSGIADTEGLLQTDVFRPGLPPATTRDMMWPIVLLMACIVFLADVVCRRVRVTFDWVPALLARLPWPGRTEAEPTPLPRIERLKQSKASATARFDAVQGALQADPPDAIGEPSAVPSRTPHEATPAAGAVTTAAAPPAVTPGDEPPATSDFTARLLDAKRRAREDQQRRR